MANFAKPENALKRAEELINVGQNQAALQALHDLITSKRHRSWQKILEKIMMKYVELCVEMRKGRIAKDGLIQYRLVCQQVNVNSLEEVIKHFMELSSQKAEQAKIQAEALDEALDVEDLEADKRPEDLMLSYVSGEAGKDRSDREHVTPWFKFLWETYRTVLDILKNNSKLETLYAMTAHKAFQFCKQYKRTTEFRRLCEIIRNHLTALHKFRDGRDRVDLSAPESLQNYLDTRVEQLKVATDLGLWQEAFRSVEDIHGLMSLVKKSPKPSVMVTYYAKLTEIFWVSDSHLYHAYAWFKLFNLQKSYNKNLTQKDLQLIASSVLLAALAVTPYDHKHGASHLDLENEKDRNLRMANLINFTLDMKRENREPLSRSSLLSDLVAKGVMTCVTQEVKDLYNLLEHELLPLDLASKVQPLLAKISKVGGKLSSGIPEVQLSQYIPALEKLTTLRVLQQVSRIFQSMKVDMLSKMIPFFNFAVVEKISVDAAKQNFVAMRVDHLSGAVHFGDLDLESDRLSAHLSTLADSLNKARTFILPPAKKQSKLGESLDGLAAVVETEHRRLLARKSIIEKRKEEHERQMLEMEKVEAKKKLELKKVNDDLEKARLAKDRKDREISRKIEIDDKINALEQALPSESVGKGRKKGPQNAADSKLTMIDLRKELEKKLQKLAKTMDHLERAKREQEAPLIRQAFEKRLEEEKILHELEQRRDIEQSKEHHTSDLQEKNRLSRMLQHKIQLQQSIVQRRQEEYERLKREREDRINQKREERRLERETYRKWLFYLDLKEKEIARERALAEERKREEEERKKREELERRAKLDAQLEKQRQRELELEEKAKAEKERDRLRFPFARGGDVAVAPPVAAAAPAPVAVNAAAEAAPPAAPAPAASGAGKYVPRHLRPQQDNQRAAPPTEARAPPQPAPRAGPSSDADRWVRGGPRSDDRPRRQDDNLPPAGSGDRWRGGPASGGSFGSSSKYSSRPRN